MLKVKAVVGEEAEALIVEYLKVQNRPFSATEISANLHGKVCFPFFSLPLFDWQLWNDGMKVDD